MTFTLPFSALTLPLLVILVAFKVTLPSFAVIFASLPVVKSLPASNLTSLPVTLPFTVALFFAVMFAFSPAVTLPANVTSFAFTFTSFAATRFPVGVFSKRSVAVTFTLPLVAVTAPPLVILLPFKVASPSFAITAASFKISNSFVAFRTTFAPSTEPPIVASTALTAASFLATKLPVSVFTKLSFALTVTFPSVEVTSPALIIFVAFKLTSFSVASIVEPSFVSIAVASISISLALRLPVPVLVNFSVASISILPAVAVTVPLFVMLSPVKVTLPAVDATFAFSSIFNVVAFNATSLAPVTLPATEAALAFTVTSFAETKLPVAVLVKLFAASTVILPSVVVTVPLFVIFVALRVRSLSAVTFAFSSTVKFAVEEITFLLLPDKFNPPTPLIVKSDPSLFVIFAESYFAIVNSFVAFIAPAAILIVDVFALSTLPVIEDGPVASTVFAVIDKGPP